LRLGSEDSAGTLYRLLYSGTFRRLVNNLAAVLAGEIKTVQVRE
jgi:hypothetical protein